MKRMYDLAGEKALNVGNSYTYTVLEADQAQYAGFFLTVADTVTVTDGIDSINLILAANEEVLLNNKITSIAGTLTGSIIFQY